MTDETRKAMTFHDLRATGITWCAVRGDAPLKIKERAGHRRFDTTEGYIREAENLREGFGAVFPELPLSLLGEWAKRATNGPSDAIVDEKVSEISGGAGNRILRNSVSTRAHVDSRKNEGARVDVSTRQPVDVGPSEVHGAPTGFASMASIECALATALSAAAAAARWDVVVQLAEELRARRLAAAVDVSALGARRRGRR